MFEIIVFGGLALALIYTIYKMTIEISNAWKSVDSIPI